MSIFDGEPGELSYPDALTYLAERVSWPTEEHGRAVVKAIRQEHGVWIEPEVPPEQLDERDREIARLKQQIAENAAKDEELRALRLQAGEAGGEEPSAEADSGKTSKTSKTGK